MANLSDLDLVNEAGDTKSQYTLLKNHATAIEAIGDKSVVASTSATATIDYDAIDGTSYFISTATKAGNISLPPVADNINMVVYVKLTAAAGGRVLKVIPDGDDEIDGVGGDIDLETAGDLIEVIGTSAGWMSRHKTIQA